MGPPGRESSTLGITARERLERSIASPIALPPGIDASQAIAVVMGELARRLTPGENHELLDGLPASLHALLCPCEDERPGHPVDRDLDRAAMLAIVATRLGTTPARAESIASAVFAAIRSELRGEIVDQVAAQLPRDITSLWLATRPIVPPLGSASATGARDRVEREIAQRTPLPDGVTASAAFAAVMTTFVTRLSGGEALDVLLGLPDELRPLVEAAAVDRHEPARAFGRAELDATVANRLGVASYEAPRIVAAVLAAVKHVLPVKEVDDVAAQLPPDLRELWLVS
jgi:uncharacterized protein (DUF2267 family)